MVHTSPVHRASFAIRSCAVLALSFVAVHLAPTLALGQGGIVGWGTCASGQCNPPPPDSGFVAVAVSYTHGLGLKADGSIVGCGNNLQGQLDVPEPNSDFVAVAAGWTHSLGLKADGSIVAWGYNYYGEVNVPAPNSGFVAVQGGENIPWGSRRTGP